MNNSSRLYCFKMRILSLVKYSKTMMRNTLYETWCSGTENVGCIQQNPQFGSIRTGVAALEMWSAYSALAVAQ